MTKYGSPPAKICEFSPAWHEYMHYLYLPVAMPETDLRISLPKNLEFLRPMLNLVAGRERVRLGAPQYVYVTARRGFASPGNPLNRPGWHADGFGTPDINYIWSDRWPTRFAVGEFSEISTNHMKSAEQFEEQVRLGPEIGIEVRHGEPDSVYRLDASMVHATPIIEAPGGDRSFFKISVSSNKYNLLGNSHNYLIDYDWTMYSRSEIRNDPAYAGGDVGPQEEKPPASGSDLISETRSAPGAV